MKVGVLALQGGFAPHLSMLRGLGHRAEELRYAAQLPGLHGLVLPGGESSTMLKLLEREGLDGPLDRFVRGGRPVLATCAGMILAAARVEAPAQRSFGWLDLDLRRNGWGRQVHSGEAEADEGGTPLLFIRAPRITRVGDAVEVLARYHGEPVLVRQGSVTGATFHPELTSDSAVHHTVFGREPESAAAEAPVRQTGETAMIQNG